MRRFWPGSENAVPPLVRANSDGPGLMKAPNSQVKVENFALAASTELSVINSSECVSALRN